MFELTLNIGMADDINIMLTTFYMDVIMFYENRKYGDCASAFQYYRTHRKIYAGSIKNDVKNKSTLNARNIKYDKTSTSKYATLQLLNSYLFSSAGGQ